MKHISLDMGNMLGIENELVSLVTAYLAKIFLVVGLIFLGLKILHKRINNQRLNSFYEGAEKPLYLLHINATKFATILAFVHGFTAGPSSDSYLITGWILGIAMVLLLVLGAWMSIKNKSQPMNEFRDSDWRAVRIIKWLLTGLVILALASHYLWTS